MTTHEVHLEIFEGPLDLLLHLIKKNDLNIYDISISQITSEYLSYIDILKEMKLDMAGEFLVMASTLMQIKARTLLPAPTVEGDEGPDPRAELINRLLEYQRYKEAARELDKRLTTFKDYHYRGAPVFSEEDYSLDATLFDLMDAFKDVLKGLKPGVREILYEEIPIEVKIREILTFLETREYATFRDILKRETTRHALIVSFLAVLELIRLKQIVARQAQIFGEIRVYRTQMQPEDISGELEVAVSSDDSAQPVTPTAEAAASDNPPQPVTVATESPAAADSPPTVTATTEEPAVIPTETPNDGSPRT